MMTKKRQMPFLPWEVRQTEYLPQDNLYYETIFTMGNGYMGVRGCDEEGFLPEKDTYPGAYLAGVYDAFDCDYVELVNCPDCLEASIQIGDQVLQMEQGTVTDYTRILNMQEGTLTRTFVWTDEIGDSTRVFWQRFVSMAEKHLVCQRLRVTPINHAKPIRVTTGLNGTVFNRRQRDYPPIQGILPNYHWKPVFSKAMNGDLQLFVRTKTTGIFVDQQADIRPEGKAELQEDWELLQVKQTLTFSPEKGQTVGFDKLISTVTSRDTDQNQMEALMRNVLNSGKAKGYDGLLEEHKHRWSQLWKTADIRIEGDEASQQGIRFNIFQLIQANASDDPRVNLPAKLLSHTRYKGNAFWDTEMFMFPFYLYNNPQAARNLLLYRYYLLDGARKNAQRRGLHGAMYPWCSAHDGSEQCDSWEYGDCEIHITADVAYAFDQYLQATGDQAFLADYAAEVYMETARFWVERVAWNEEKQAYTLLTVKGPDEYCSVTNNNMFTNYMAAWNLMLAENAVVEMKKDFPDKWSALREKIGFSEEEPEKWREVREHMAQNWVKKKDLLIQDDLFLDLPEEDLSKFADRTMPVLEIVGYEHVMRFRMLRQADVLHLMFLLNDEFTEHQKQVAYDFYEPLTTHDSSLSFNTHCIMAAELGMKEKAMNYFFKTCRLDLDDEQDTTCSGLHGASLGGTWQAVVNGFAGLRIHHGMLSFKPMLPPQWTSLTFCIHAKGRVIQVSISSDKTVLRLMEGEPLTVLMNGTEIEVS